MDQHELHELQMVQAELKAARAEIYRLSRRQPHLFICRELQLLHPDFRETAERFGEHLEKLHREDRTFPIFVVGETFRSPMRQGYLYEAGISTHEPWLSAHQYGRAVDYHVDGIIPFEHVEAFEMAIKSFGGDVCALAEPGHMEQVDWF